MYSGVSGTSSADAVGATPSIAVVDSGAVAVSAMLDVWYLRKRLLIVELFQESADYVFTSIYQCHST